MTKKEVINQLKIYKQDYTYMMNDDAVDMAINALEQESMEKKVIKMRDATLEERRSVDEYIKNISTTVIDSWNLEPSEDAISRENAILQIQKHQICSGDPEECYPEQCERNVISWLNNLPPVTSTPLLSEDCVSRQAVLERINDWWGITATSGEPTLCDYIRELPSVTPTQRWIPVSERLPEKNVEVLATTQWGAVTIAEMYSANDWFIHEGTTNAEIDEIVAWMPLPEPYKA